MKRLLFIILTMAFVFGLAAAIHAATEKFETKAGDTIYVCGCGEGCMCGAISNAEGECACGKKLVKTTVNKIENDRVFYTVDGKELSASLTGKYRCGCKECQCNMISQKPGKCGCGKQMMKGREY